MHFNNLVLWGTFTNLWFITGCFGNTTEAESEEAAFYYFAYGSNMLDKRIHINNPSAVFYSGAVLKDYRLDFNIQSSLWKGAVATICNEPGDTVWGVLWILKKIDRCNLDKQEGVRFGVYYPVYINVKTINGQELSALTYMEYYQPKKLPSWKDLPPERRPSITYINVMIAGAVQVGLPLEYSKMLCSVPHNNKHAASEILTQLGKPFSEMSISV